MRSDQGPLKQTFDLVVTVCNHEVIMTEFASGCGGLRPGGGNSSILFKSSRFVGLDGVRKALMDIALCYCGIQQCPPLHNNGPQVRDTSFLHIVMDGKGCLKMDNRIFILGKNDVFLIPRGVSAQYTADKDEPWTYMWVGFSGLLGSEGMEKAGLSLRCPVRKVREPEVFLTSVERMISACKMTYSDDLRRTGAFFQFLADLVDDYQAQSLSGLITVSGNRSGDYARQAYDYIVENYFRPMKITTVANGIGISRNYLFLCFKEIYGCSPKQFLNSVRMEHAATMLVSGNLSVGEISRRVGIEDELSFSKSFKAYFHVAPTEYRKKNVG